MNGGIEGTALRAQLSPLDRMVDVDRLLGVVNRSRVDVREAFATYVAEALFFRRLLAAEIDALAPGSHVVEIGSGIGLLARLIAAEGHTVTAFEPEAPAFACMHEISGMFEESWRGEHPHVVFVYEEFSGRTVVQPEASLIVAMNVIEHVAAPAQLIVAATNLLTPSGTARFICPNYAFPYEPHFNVPTALNKQLTHLLARHAIARSPISDAERFWSDLSWVTPRKLRRSLSAAGVQFRFSRNALQAYVARLDEPSFGERKGPLFRSMLRVGQPLLAAGANRFPITLAPVIDLTTRRPE
jgi:2-polyprenyl-3-methyl-5-hydroxy-6-metoxy-1,4-benzoquinol methylase